MALLNYTTKVSVSSTVSQISQILGEKGAQRVMIEYHDCAAKAVTFNVVVADSPIHFRLPCNPQGVAGALRKQRKQSVASNPAQCERIAWRIVKDWVEAQMALVEAGQAEIAEVFLPYAIENSGRTFYELFVDNHQKQLGDGR